MSQSIITKLDQLLKDDKNLDTRAGLHFVLELVKDSFKYIESERVRQAEEKQQLEAIKTRLGHVEHGLTEFLTLREAQLKEAETERQKWRWVIITPMAGYLVLELLKWIFR